MNAHEHYRLAERFSRLLDEEFNIFGFKFGLDPLISLVPFLGDVLGFALSFYILWIGVQMNMPSGHIVRMAINIILDFLIGIIPVVGDVSDFIFKANTKNFRILKEFYYENAIEGVKV